FGRTADLQANGGSAGVTGRPPNGSPSTTQPAGRPVSPAARRTALSRRPSLLGLGPLVDLEVECPRIAVQGDPGELRVPGVDRDVPVADHHRYLVDPDLLGLTVERCSLSLVGRFLCLGQQVVP